MNKKLWEKAINSEVVVNCNSKKECDDYLYMCNKKKVTVANEVRDNAWETYGENVCFNISHNDMYFGSLQYFNSSNHKIITYTELMGDKKTFTGPELAQMMIDGKTKAGMKFISEIGLEYKIVDYDTKHRDGIVQVLYRDKENKIATNGELIYRTFTIIEEPKLYYFNQVRNSGKRIRIKGWDNFYTLQEMLRILADYNCVGINQAFNKKIWEVEE
jgi:hypothetical protein